VPLVAQILDAELARAGRTVDRNLCEHFAYTRQELFQIVKLGRVESFEQLLASHGRGGGCEVCRPAVASILASTWNDFVLKHQSIQDTNDRFLANIQRGGTYSVVPRIPGGEITPDKLIAIGEIAKRFDLYCKITGGQRIDLLGARVEQLPEIWEALVDAGFESGHAYGKAMRTVKSCVGSTWCRFGVQDSTQSAKPRDVMSCNLLRVRFKLTRFCTGQNSSDGSVQRLLSAKSRCCRFVRPRRASRWSSSVMVDQSPLCVCRDKLRRLCIGVNTPPGKYRILQ